MSAFVVFEGIDGCGKTSQVNRATQYLRARMGDVLVVQTKDLGGSKLGEELRRIMYSVVPPKDMGPSVLDLVFLTGHVQNWHTLVKPALQRGMIVVSDRWWMSQFAYVVGRDYDQNVLELYDKLKGGWPDLTIYLYGNPHVLLARANARADSANHQCKKDWNSAEKQTRVHEEFMRLFSLKPGWRPVCVDGKNEEQVWLEVKALLDDALRSKNYV